MLRQGSSGRLPLRPRNSNVDQSNKGPQSSSKQSSNLSIGSTMSRASAASSSDNPSKYSYLADSSGNENNERLTTLASAALTNSALRKLGGNAGGAGAGESDSSTVVQTGQRIASNLLGGSGSGAPGSSSSGRARGRSDGPPPAAVRERTARSASPATSSSSSAARSAAASLRSASSQRSRQPPPLSARSSSSVKSKSIAMNSGSSADEIIIEEHRRRSSGDGYTVHKYVRGRQLGKGGFAKVYWCTSLDTNRHYAVKVVPKANLVKSRARQKLQAEIKIHRTLKHKNICEFKHFFEDKTNCYILLELCHNQSMNELIKRRKRLTETEVKYYMLHLIDAVKYMHANNVIHRDLKLGNLFLDKHLRLKVGDLGLATKLSSSEEKRKTVCGTPNYIAPEVIDGNKETRGHSFEVDIWSMGVILFTTLVGKPPYESKDVKSTYQRILANQYSFPSHVPISQHARDLITSMLQTSPQKRPSLEQISSHPFFSHVKGNLPKSLPSSCIHVAPNWQEDAYGNLIVVESRNNEENSSRPTASTSQKKYNAALAAKAGASSASGRQPLSTKDPNVAEGTPASVAHKPKADESRTTPILSRGRDAESRLDERRAPCISSETRTKSSRKFNIFDDNRGTEAVQDHQTDRVPSARKSQHSKPPQSQPPEHEVDGLVEKVSACTLHDNKSTPTPPKHLERKEFTLRNNRPTPTASKQLERKESPAAVAVSSPALAPSSSRKSNSGGKDASVSSATKNCDKLVLESMHNRLVDMFKLADKKAAGADDDDILFDRMSQASFTEDTDKGATKWVTRYVDYTSKYGLGFLLNNGSAGVYFNDSTKAVIAPEGETFMYVERRKTGTHGNERGSGRADNTCEIHTLSSYPESLQKKVTLLKHFRNYLVDQQKRAVEEREEDAFSTSLDLEAASEADGTSLVYLKKWVRTKHAILFRLSNSTIQVVFYDHTEILLSSEARSITYVDKKHRRITYHLHEIVIQNNAEISKRLKYVKDILQQLISC